MGRCKHCLTWLSVLGFVVAACALLVPSLHAAVAQDAEKAIGTIAGPFAPTVGLEKYKQDTGQTEVHPDNSAATSYKGGMGQCAWFVKAVRIDLDKGKIFKNTNGDAWEWYDYFTNTLGWKAGSTPKPGAIMCFGRGKGMPSGHVAVVRAVHTDGTLDIWDSNCIRDGLIRKRRIMAAQPLLEGYLYAADSETPPVAWAPAHKEVTPQPTQVSLYPVEVHGKWGYINPAGELVIDASFDGAGLFACGLAWVRVGGKYGYIDTAGKLVIPPQFHDAIEFCEDRAIFRINDNYVCIDKTGRRVSCRYTPEFFFSDGLAPASDGNGMGYIDKGGKVVIPAKFSTAGPFQDGLAVVDMRGKGSCLINKAGTVVLQCRYHFAEFQAPFDEGLARVIVDKKMGFMDKKGVLVIKAVWDVAAVFREGLAAVFVGNKMGFIDQSGRIVIQPTFTLPAQEHECGFAEGLAPAVLNDRCHYIDHCGKVVFSLEPGYIGMRFQGGLAVVVGPNGLGYVDKTGNYVWKPQK